MPSDKHFYKVGAIAAIVGALVLLVTTLLHPLQAHPGDAPAAFAEYAADRFWIATHLGQLLGVVLIGGGLVSLTWCLRAGRGGVWAMLGAAGALISIAMAGVLQAVDGIALKVMVDRWSGGAVASQPLVFEAAFGVRQVEVGVSSVMAMLFGLTVTLYGVALLVSSKGSQWLGWLGIVAGSATLVAGVVQAHTGFSDAAMATSMPSGLILLLWAVLAGVFLLRKNRES